MFQDNKNVFSKNLETQVRQLALAMQNQSRDSFLSNTKKNLKDCIVVTLRSGKELQEREEAEKKKNEVETENAGQNSVGCEKRQKKIGLSHKNE